MRVQCRWPLTPPNYVHSAGPKKRIHRSALFERSRPYRDHLWFPLVVDPDLASPELVDRLAEQVAVIVAAASPPPNPGSRLPVAEAADTPEEDAHGL
jgi:hypothetical protein